MTKPSTLATRPQDYQRLGITTDIQPFEDGRRTDPARPGHYEWWYYDAHLDNGAKLVVNFLTKDPSSPRTGLLPIVMIDLDLPGGASIHKWAVFDPGDFASSTQGCDVRIAGNRVTGDLHHYTIHAVIDEVSVDVELTGTTPPWRPATGHIWYGAAERDYFAWLPAVPAGTTQVTYGVGGEVTTATGLGYHDHNWGNVALPTVVNNWYWGRGVLGPYTFITARIISEKAYGYEPVTVFMLAKDGRVIADDGTHVAFTKSGIHPDPATGKPVADVHSYAYDGSGVHDAGAHYALTYNRRETIMRMRFIESLQGVKRLAARLAGFDGAYLRFRGTVSIDAAAPGMPSDHLTGDALWELMYFGKHAHEAA